MNLNSEDKRYLSGAAVLLVIAALAMLLGYLL